MASGPVKKRPRRPPEPVRRTSVRYYDADGRRCPKGTPGATATPEEGATYYALVRPLGGGGRKRYVSLQTTNLQVAWKRLNDHLAKLLNEDLGIRDEFHAAAEKSLAGHLDDWIAVVGSRGPTGKQVKGLRSKLDALAELAGWRRITDLTHDSLSRALAALQAPSKAKPRGRSARTRNHHLDAAKQFSRWAAGPGKRLRSDPFVGMKPVGIDADRRRVRRLMTDDEIQRLFDHLDHPDAPAFDGMAARQRALGYRVAMATGFRANELRALTPASFDLAACTVTLPAAGAGTASRPATPATRCGATSRRSASRSR